MTVPKRHATTIPLAVPAPGVVKSSGWRQLGTRGVRAGYLVIARCSYLASSFLLFVVLVRLLPRAELDLLALGLSWLVVLSVGYDFGLNEYFVRLLADHEDSAGERLPAALVTKFALMLAVTAVFAAITGLLYRGEHRFLLLAATVAAAGARSLCDFAESALIAVGELRSVCLFALAQAALTLLGGLAVARWVAAEAAPVLFAQAILCGLLVVPRLVKLGCNRLTSAHVWVALRASPALLRRSAPFGVMSIAASLSVAAPVIVMSLLPNLTTGMAPMQAAQRLWTTALALGQGPYTRLYAAFSRQALRQDEARWPRLAAEALLTYNVVAAAICIGTVLVGPALIGLIFTKRLPETAPLFTWLAACLPFVLTALVPGAWLPSRHGERPKMMVVGAACLMLWSILFVLGRHVTPANLAGLVSAVWILQSVAMLWAARRLKGMRPPWFAALLCPAASSSVVLGSLVGNGYVSMVAAVVVVGCLWLSWRQLLARGSYAPAEPVEV